MSFLYHEDHPAEMKPCFHILPLLLYAVLVQFSVEYVILDEDIVPFENLQTDNESVQKNITNCHNSARRRVKPPAANMLKMQWSTELAKSAQNWANLCYLNHSTVNYRTMKGSACGENIMKSPVPLPWQIVVKTWEAEKKFLIFGEGAINDEVTAHYTQLVADNTHEVGCGVAECPGNITFYVCRYFTAGNEPETLYTPYIIGKPCSECKKACDGNKLCLNYCPFPNLRSNCQGAIDNNLCHLREVKMICRASCECKDKIK